MNCLSTKLITGVCVCCITLAGCAAFEEAGQMDKFEKTVTSYNALIRWGDFMEAAAYRLKRDEQFTVLDTKHLKNIRVTSYERKSVAFAPDKMTAYVVMEFTYYNDYSPAHRRLVDKQTWVYDANTKVWQLDGDLPKFGVARR